MGHRQMVQDGNILYGARKPGGNKTDCGALVNEKFVEKIPGTQIIHERQVPQQKVDT